MQSGRPPPARSRKKPIITFAGGGVHPGRELGHEVDVATRAAHGKVTSHTLTYAAIAGMLNSVHDKYTVFMTPKEFADLNQGLDGGTFGGTGMESSVLDR